MKLKEINIPKKFQEMYEMELHQYFYMGDYKVTRVPGGWLYVYRERHVTFVEQPEQTVLIPSDSPITFNDLEPTC